MEKIPFQLLKALVKQVQISISVKLYQVTKFRVPRPVHVNNCWSG